MHHHDHDHHARVTAGRQAAGIRPCKPISKWVAWDLLLPA